MVLRFLELYQIEGSVPTGKPIANNPVQQKPIKEKSPFSVPYLDLKRKR